MLDALARCLPCGSDCFPMPEPQGRDAFEDEKDQEEYIRLVNFLGAVPLFKKQLPKDDLPKVADALTRTEWPVGSKVVEQGAEGKAFFIIVSGEASVVMNENGEEIHLATLYNMDYFGGHTLTSRRPNVADIVVKGPEALVTLSMSRDRFVELGLDRKLKLPRRPAIYDGRSLAGEGASLATLPRGETARSLRCELQVTEEEVEFICRAVEQNANLRARTGNLQSDAVQKMAKMAEKLEVKAGEELCKGGQVGTRFIILAEGHLDILHDPSSTLHLGAEAMLAKSHVTERLVRKHRFLLNMFKKGYSTFSTESCSMPVTEDLKFHEDQATQSWPSRPRKSRTTDDADPLQAGALRSRQIISHQAANGEAPMTAAFSCIDSAGSSKRSERRRKSDGGAIKVNKLPIAGDDDDLDTGQVNEASRLYPGDSVFRVVAGDGRFTKEEGQVIEMLEDGLDGTYLVEFQQPQGKVHVKRSQLRAIQVGKTLPVARLAKGECFGELCLLYNTRQVATCRAVEDSVIYTIHKKHFQECFTRRAPRHDEYCKLFDEVHLLTPLLRAERMEMARKVTGRFTFQPNEVVVRQGEIKPHRLWYVIEQYDCIITKATPDGGEEELRKFFRAEHFGERQIFLGEAASEFTVKAGKHGLCCVGIEGDILLNLPLDKNRIMAGKVLADLEDGDCPQVPSDLDTYVKMLPQVSEKCNISLESLELVGVLGEGGFGSVLLARHDGEDYALKRLSKGWVVQSNVQQNVVAERDLLAMMSSPFIIRLHRSYRDDQWVYMLIEYCPGGHLLGLMEKHKEVLFQDRPRGTASMFYSVCVSYALEYLHDKNVMYRDLKLENVLLDEIGYAKLCDMGFARFVHGKSYTQAGTPDYMAPEIIDPPHAHDKMVDWYSLGVLTCELLSGQVPYDDEGLDDVAMCLEVLRVAQEKGIPKNLFGSKLVMAEDFVRKLLLVDPKRRLGAKDDGKEIRSHGWFQGFDFQGLLNRTLVSPYRASAIIMEKRLGTTRTVKDHVKINTELFRVYKEGMPGDEYPDWDKAFDC